MRDDKTKLMQLRKNTYDIFLLIQYFRKRPLSRNYMRFDINYIVIVLPFCSLVYIDESHYVAMSATPRRHIVFPEKVTLCHHKVNRHHSYLNHHCKKYIQPRQGINQKQHK